MASTAMMSSLVQTPLVSRNVMSRPSRAVAVVRASQQSESSRREVLSLFAGVLSLGLAGAAQAAKPAFQESLGSGPKSTSAASGSSYTMEGTKKRGIGAKKKRSVLAAAKEKALKNADK